MRRLLQLKVVWLSSVTNAVDNSGIITWFVMTVGKNELLSVMTSIDRQDGSHDGKITYSQFAVALDKADEIQEDAREFYEVNKNFFEQN